MPRDQDPPDLEALLAELIGAPAFRSFEDADRAMAQRVSEYNSRPQQELGGLSPDMMHQLLYGDWRSQGALRIDGALTLGDLAGSAILADARTLLRYVQSEGPLKLTTGGNMKRAAVSALLPQLRMPRDAHGELEMPPTKKIDETDVPWLPDLRYVLMFGKLLARRTELRVTPLGRRLLSEDLAGELYAHLFRTFFRVLDLSVLDGGGLHPGLQAGIAYSLYKLRTVANEWRTARALAELAWLESAKDPLDFYQLQFGDSRFISFRNRLLDPLVHFALLDVREVPGKPEWPREHEYRCTKLFARVLSFRFERI